jgi:hypothetical protein
MADRVRLASVRFPSVHEACSADNDSLTGQYRSQNNNVILMDFRMFFIRAISSIMGGNLVPSSS